MKKLKETSTVRLVLDLLRDNPDEFMRPEDVMQHVPRNKNAINAALHHLRSHRCVDVVIQNGRGWWFVLPADGDTRTKTIDEHAPHPSGDARRRRRRGDR